MLATAAEVPPVEGPVTVAPDAADAVPAEDPAAAAEVAAPPPVAPLEEPARRRPPPDLDTLPPPSLGAGELLGPIFKTMLMLAIVLGIAYLTLHKGLGKLIARQNLGRRIKVVERVALDPRRALFLVELDGKQLLLGAGEGGVVLIKEMGTGAADKPASFAEALEAQRPEKT